MKIDTSDTAFLACKKGFILEILQAMWVLCTVWLLSAPQAQADAIAASRAMKASTIAEIFIKEDHVKVTLEIGPSDLLAFHNLLPDEIVQKMKVDALPFKERLARFFTEDLTIRADGGAPIIGEIQAMEGRSRITRDDITGEPIASSEGEGVLAVTIIYPLEKNRPSTISIKPPSNNKGFATANIGFVTYHKNLPVNDFRHLSLGLTIDLDWDDPWYSKFRNSSLWRRFNEPISAFLYIEPFEVRVEVIARPKDLQQWLDLGIEGRDTLPVDIQSELKEKIGVFLAKQISLSIDGKEAKPTLERIHFLRRTLRASTVIEPAEELDSAAAVVGAIFVYRTSGLPEQASLTWNLFSPKMPRVRAAATDEAGPLPYILRPDDNVLKWQNYLTNPTIPKLVDVDLPVTTGKWHVPVLSIVLALCGLLALFIKWMPRWPRVAVCCGICALSFATRNLALAEVESPFPVQAQLNADELTSNFSKLLQNIYVSFEFQGEEAIYDKLARSVDGELLSQVYLETRESLVLENQGGAEVKVNKVEVIEVEQEMMTDEGVIIANCVWGVTGSVGHWGHVHQRTNKYQAKISLKVVDDEWKIVGLDLLNEERVE